MIFGEDGKKQPKVEWQVAGAWKLAWIQDRRGTDKDWAGTGRYLNVVRTEGPGCGPGGNATDFPITSALSDRQILTAFVHAVSAVTGQAIPDK
ncbi:hypothetical protein [Camelimonas lactis]|uniref:Uncharacterized protein n=1 Tax=Camelimonas lactis TaxID=659006 RepID=A0A4R2GHD5_9HYPH|nr:hypothetical protein [Camelimonas lactis]TCO07531.1 hypothetical protein EV666_13212 [Camelimonas lactis]